MLEEVVESLRGLECLWFIAGGWAISNLVGRQFRITRAVFFNRLGELRDRTYENQQHRASGLNLVVAAIAVWNTVYLQRAIRALQERRYVCDQQLLAHLSPLKWEHINLTGDYNWRRDGGLRNRKLRLLRRQPLPGFAP